MWCCARWWWCQLFAGDADVSSFTSNVHLCHYGAGYYSYLMCRVYAQAVWRRLFEADPLSRTAGQRYIDSVLRYGGAKQPHLILHDLFGHDPQAPLQHFLHTAPQRTQQRGDEQAYVP